MPWGYRPTRGVKYKRRLHANDLAKSFGLHIETVREMARAGRLTSRKEPSGEVTFPYAAIGELVRMGHHVKL
jgi:hypothetical protein